RFLVVGDSDLRRGNFVEARRTCRSGFDDVVGALGQFLHVNGVVTLTLRIDTPCKSASRRSAPMLAFSYDISLKPASGPRAGEGPASDFSLKCWSDCFRVADKHEVTGEAARCAVRCVGRPKLESMKSVYKRRESGV